MSTLRWPVEDLWERLEPQLPGLSVEVLAEVDSTNTRLLERARQGDTAACLLVAERQHAGRGRQGRAWQSAPGASLTFSLGLPLSPQRWGGLSLAVGVALAEALHPLLRIKWPNDLWTLDDHGAPAGKLGGILIETQGQAAAGPARPAPSGGLAAPARPGPHRRRGPHGGRHRLGGRTQAVRAARLCGLCAAFRSP
jgi:BirA family biotin operon repressor/biotin-[acetyl-CoA-carboxylase] ligase